MGNIYVPCIYRSVYTMLENAHCCTELQHNLGTLSRLKKMPKYHKNKMYL